MKAVFDQSAAEKVKSDGPFLTVNQSLFTEVEVANQWHCRAHNNLCPILHKRTCAFCLWANLRPVDPGMNRKQ